MHTLTRTTFTTVKTEGAILPADLLQRIADGRGLEGLTPADYHLAPNERLNEAINRSWNRCLGVWRSFDEQRSRLPAGDTGITLTRERWLLILFQELGYGRLPFQGKLTVGGGTEGAVDYPISHQWEHVPIHLVSFRQDLDRRDPLAKRSPHSLVQEYLNRADDTLWGFASNGLRLRIMRDNASLTRAAYVEFDLEAMLTGELYADFSLLWLVCHQSRVEAGQFWLERWSQAAAEQGTRALDALRQGVQDAIAALGRGFLRHPANGALKAALRSGELSRDGYYRQLLRLVYRLIFLLVAEDRDLLLTPDAGPLARARYRDYYSVDRLRSLAEARRGGPHPDLYRTLRLVCEQLRGGNAALGLPALGGFLFSSNATPNLDAAELANSDLLAALRELAFTEEGRARRPVDYKNLGSEELGSVYESLLELHPHLNTDAGTFELTFAAGSERKTTGSYYTPTSLINSLLDSALEPVVEARLKGAGSQVDREKAVLSIKVVDPAAGSGHFLIAAAHRLARHLARIRTGDEEPSPAALRAALRDVVRRCIHGVDINPMAVELCKVALWMETLDPGKPLSFLDRNIQCGNSLIGATPRGLEEGIPDAAFTPVTGDDRAYCSEFKRLNKREREQQALFTRDLQPWERLGSLAAGMAQLDATDDATLAGVQHQEALYEELVRSSDYRYGRLLADAWAAAFVWQKTRAFAYPITEQVFRQIERNPFNLPKWMEEEIERLAGQYQFFHWHLAFPHVFTLPRAGAGADNETAGWCGGFDVVCGNPPWERIKLQEQEFFATRDPEIAAAPNKAARQRLIDALPKTNPALAHEFAAAQSAAEASSKFVRASSRFPLTAVGDVNTYALFAELSRTLLSSAGRAGIIVPTGIATDDTTKGFLRELIETHSLVSFLGMDNEACIYFPGIDHRNRFGLLCLAGSEAPVSESVFTFFCSRIEFTKMPERRFTLNKDDFALLNPNSRTCPVFRTRADAELTKRLYQRLPVLIEQGGQNPWDLSFLRMFDMSNDSQFFALEPVREYRPLYEAKLLHHFDHRWATFQGVSDDERSKGLARDLNPVDKAAPTLPIVPRYWVPQAEVTLRLSNRSRKWLLAFRGIASSNLERTAVLGLLPLSGVGNSAPVIELMEADTATAACFLANFNSLCFDYVARQKIAGVNLNFFVIEQLPALPPKGYRGQDIVFIVPRVLELVYTAWDMAPFAADLWREWGDSEIGSRELLHTQWEVNRAVTGGHPWNPPRWANLPSSPDDPFPTPYCPFPPFKWDEDRRALLRAELDAYYARLYSLTRKQLRYILDPADLTPAELRDILDPWEEVADPLDPAGYAARAAASDFPGETFRVLKEKEQRALGEYRTRRLVLAAWDRLEEELGPVVVRNYREEMEAGSSEIGIKETGPTYQAAAPQAAARPRFGAVQPAAAPAKPAPAAESRADPGQGPLFGGAPVAPSPAPDPPPAAYRPAPAAQPQAVQPALIPTPPQGSYQQRLSRVMALRGKGTSEAIGELVAALGDEDGNIRWLAASVLQGLGGGAVIATLRAFVDQAPSAVAREEAERVLGRLVG